MAAAVELLDEAGEGALTVRALSERLSTGSGAIYHHVGTMNELLAAAVDAVVADALTARPTGRSPGDEIRAAALALFDAVAEHPWLAGQLATQITRNPWGPVTLRVFEAVGRPLEAVGVARAKWFVTASTLVHYLLGATTQTAGGAPEAADRAGFLDTAAAAWHHLDPGEHPFTRAIADQVRDHDDREQFVSGIDLVLRGITATA